MTKEGIIQKVFKKYHLEHISGYYFITDKEFNDVMFRLKKELIAEIIKANDGYPKGFIRLEKLIGDTE